MLEVTRVMTQGDYTVRLDLNTLCWDNGVDFAPEYLYEHIKAGEKVA